MSHRDTTTAAPTGWSCNSLSAAVVLWWHGIPLGCRCLLVAAAFCSLLWSSAEVCLSAHYDGIMRFTFSMFVSTWRHHGLLHFVMNASALLSIGPSIEMRLGTYRWFVLVAWFTTLCNLLFVGAEWVLAEHLRAISPSCVVGMSGMLFALMAYDAWQQFYAAHNDTNVSFFGAWTMKARWAPFALLALLCVLLPGSSFLMHLCGALLGVISAALPVVDRLVGTAATWACPGDMSLCSRCRHFEEGSDRESPGVRSTTTSGDNHGQSGSIWSRLPSIHPSVATFEPFSGQGRRLGTTNLPAVAVVVQPQAVVVHADSIPPASTAHDLRPPSTSNTVI